MIEVASNFDELRACIEKRLSPKRFYHTVCVEEMSRRLSRLYCPQKEALLAAAALLHDITKEYTVSEHVSILKEHGEPVTRGDVMAHKTLHGRTAAIIIKEEFTAFADPELLSAVRYHTTGKRGMTVFDMLLYLADWIDASRTYPKCVQLRSLFWDARPEQMAPTERERHLLFVMKTAFDLSIGDLLEDGLPITLETVDARNELLEKLS